MDNIHLDTHYTRSIHLERDVNSIDILSAYIPTSRAMQTLANIADTFNTQSMQRAWSLIGSYGSGKSSFAAFLAHLLENPQLETHGIAKALLQKHNPDFANNLCFHDNGYCIVLLTGSPESLSKRFIAALHQAASNYLPPDTVVCQKLAQAKQTNLTTTEIIDLLKQVQQAVINQAGQGILIVIDELGKFLEYEARHQGTNDIFLLQAIAEHAYQGSTANILLVVLMHQAFEQYAKGLSDRLKNEWLKVQGRFENISFLESAEQTLRVMAAAFRNQLPEQQKQQIAQQTTSCVAVLAQQNALYTGLSVENATDILTSCYPLHPIAALILPILCQKVAQNERTLFSYLGSQEAFGFKHSLERVQFDNWVLPWEIFQYFIENQPLATTDHITHRRWAEVMTALERLGDAEELEVQLLKTIGLFNIIGSQAGFKASNELLALCFKQTIETCLIQLQKKSIINYRKFNSEYRIWQGSDFDLTLALQETKQQLGYFNLAQTLERRNKLQPILARKYSIQKTMIRYFQPHYADSETSVEFFKNTNQPRIIFFLAENQNDTEKFKKLAQIKTDLLTLYLLCENAEQIKMCVSEAIALETIQLEHAEIKSDPVAQTEIKDYLHNIKQQETELLNDYLEHPESYQWFWRGKPLELANKKVLQNQLSEILETVYYQAPLIKNELINRHKPSGQANAAKNKLITALLNNAHLENLGFEANKYPAEKTIYQAVFKETGIHVKKQHEWQLQNPPENNPYQLHTIWNELDKYLNNSSTPQPLTELYTRLENPPYGVQTGVLSLIFIAYYLTNQRTLALYESGIFCPVVTPEIFEILSKRPELFSIEAINLTGIRAELFNGYLEKLIGKIEEDNTLLDIIKPLAKFINNLPEYTRYSKNLEPKTIAVRDAFQHTQSPYVVLFETLPQACGYSSFLNEEEFNNNPDKFLNELVKRLNKLNKHYKNLLDEFQQQLAEALKEPAHLTLAELRVVIQKKYAGLDKYSNDLQGLKAFIIRLQDNKETDTAWLESVASLLGGTPPDKWRQTNRANAEYRLSDLSDRLLQLALVHSHQLKANADTQVTIFRVVNEKDASDKIAYLTEELREQARAVVDSAFKDTNQQLKLAIVAELLNTVSV